MKHQIILASASPRRKELLEQIGLSFTVQAADGEEKCEARLPQKQVEELSLHKAAEVAGKAENNAVVIGADTLVFFRGKPLGKPRNEQEAVLMLKALQGQTHQVYTGVTLIWRQGGSMRQMSFHERTDVTVWPMTEEEIEEYVRSGEPMDKAGAYAIQGLAAMFVIGLDGDYYNVMGLPVCPLAMILRKFGVKLLGC